MDTKTKKVVFADLDGTLIETITGHTHPKGVWDVKLKLKTFQAIKEAFPKMKYLFVVTNQGRKKKEEGTQKLLPIHIFLEWHTNLSDLPPPSHRFVEELWRN